MTDFGVATAAPGETCEPATREASTRTGTTGRSLLANVSALAAGQATTWLATLATTLVVPRFIGPASMGVLVSAYSVTAILGVVLGIGTRNYLVRRVVAGPDSASETVSAALQLRVWLTPVFFAAVWCYGRLAGYGPQARTVLYLTTAATVLALIAEPAQAVFQAQERMAYLAYSDVLNKTAGSLGGIALVLLGYGIVALSVSALVVSVLVLAVDLWWLRGALRVSARPSLRAQWRLARESAPYWAFGVFYMVYLWIDSVMLALLAPSTDVGWYGVATRLFTTTMFIPVIVSTAWLPRLVAAHERSLASLWDAAQAPFALVIVLSLPVAVGVASLGPPAVALLYGSSFSGAGSALAVLAGCIPLMYANIILNQILTARNRPMLWTWLMLGATIVNPVLNFGFIRLAQARWHNGAVGAALSLVCTELLIVVVGMAIVGRHVVGRRTLDRVLRAAVAAAVMAVAFETRRWIGLMPAAVLGGGAFLAAGLLLRILTPDEVAVITARVRGRARRRAAAAG